MQVLLQHALYPSEEMNGLILSPGYLMHECRHYLSHTIQLSDNIGCGLFHLMDYNVEPPQVS